MAAAITDQQALAAAAAAASAGATPVETGLVVLTREEGKNDKLRARLEEMQVRGMRVDVWVGVWMGTGRGTMNVM